MFDSILNRLDVIQILNIADLALYIKMTCFLQQEQTR